jgi:hypothetical protein
MIPLLFLVSDIDLDYVFQASPSDPENFPFVVLGNKVDVDGGNSRVVCAGTLSPNFSQIFMFGNACVLFSEIFWFSCSCLVGSGLSCTMKLFCSALLNYCGHVFM